MHSSPIKSIAVLAVLIFALAPVLVFAHAGDMPFPYWGPLLSCTGAEAADGGGLPQCESVCDIFHTGQHILYLVLSLALFVIAPLMFAWGGIVMMTSAGSPERVSSGRKLLTSTLIGLAIIFGAFIIVNTFFYLAAGFAPGIENVEWSKIQCTPRAK